MNRSLDSDMLSLTIGERNVEHPVELARAATWLEAQLRGAGYEPQRQTYDVAGMECANIEAELHGSSAPDEIVLVGAHYDCVGEPRRERQRHGRGQRARAGARVCRDDATRADSAKQDGVCRYPPLVTWV